MRRAIVHIGMPRTGSTSFQGVLTNLRPRLDEAGVLYPDLGPPGEVNHRLLSRALVARLPTAERRAQLEAFDAALATTGADTVLLSDEYFSIQRPSLDGPEVLRGVLARRGFAMEAAIVVKPQDEQLNSSYALSAQLVKELGTFRDFVVRNARSARLNYEACVAPWRQATGGRVTAIALRDAGSDRPLLERVIRALGLERILALTEGRELTFTANRSAGPVVVEASRRLRVHRAHRQVSGHSRYIGHFLDDTAWARGLDPEPFRGDAGAAMDEVRERFAVSNEQFAREHWGTAWDAVVRPAPARPPNELAGRPIPPETEAHIQFLVRAAIERFGFRTLAAWRRTPAEAIEAATGRLARLLPVASWKVD